MADYFTHAVIQPSLPATVVTPEIRALLNAMEVHTEDDGDAIYLCCETSPSDLDADMLEEAGVPADHPLWGLVAGGSVPDFEVVLQTLLTLCDMSIPCITVEYAYTCNKMRPDGFGGACTWISRYSIRGWSTQEALQDLSREDQTARDIEVAVALAGAVVPAMDDVPTAQAQREALARLTDRLANDTRLDDADVTDEPAVPLWENNGIQFARLLSELRSLGLSSSQYINLCRQTDLTLEEIDGLLERAEACWQRQKNATASRVA